MKTILLYTIAGAILGALLCCLVAFVTWDLEVFDSIFIPIRITTVLGLIISLVKQY